MALIKKLSVFLALVAVLGVAVAHAEEVPVPAPAPADASSDANLMAQEKSAGASAGLSSADVWWGNRSIAWGNYIKFDKPNPKACCCDHRKVCVAGCAQGCGDCEACKLITFDKIFFDLDKSVLRPAGREECDRVVKYMNENPDVDVLVQGHCCDLASDAYNVGLGQRRADSVKRYLTEHGIAGSRIKAVSFGERQPWQPLEHRELNRRAIVIVVPDEHTASPAK